MTDDLTKLRAEWRAGLDGVTPGPWAYVPHFFSNGDIRRRSICIERSKYDWIDFISEVEGEADAAHIARCSPENIRALLDALDTAERELDVARGIIAAVKIQRDEARRDALEEVIELLVRNRGATLPEAIKHIRELKDRTP